MGQNMKGNGKMIYKMDLGLKLGMMVLGMKEHILMEKNKEKEYIHGLMGKFFCYYFFFIK